MSLPGEVLHCCQLGHVVFWTYYIPAAIGMCSVPRSHCILQQWVCVVFFGHVVFWTYYIPAAMGMCSVPRSHCILNSLHPCSNGCVLCSLVTLYSELITSLQQWLCVLFLGHDTTASAISWAMFSLAEHLEIQAECQREVDALLKGRETDDILW